MRLGGKGDARVLDYSTSMKLAVQTTASKIVGVCPFSWRWWIRDVASRSIAQLRGSSGFISTESTCIFGVVVVTVLLGPGHASEIVTVKMERVLTWVVVVEDDFDTLVVLKNEGFGVDAVDCRV